jgi:signal transduction histidine kinase
MSKMWHIMKGLLVTLYLALLLHAMLNNTSISIQYDFPTWFLPAIAFGSILIIGMRYVKASIRSDDVEREFISIVNHTFRTPLTSISWFAKELENELPREERINYLQSMVNSTDRILGIVDLLTGIKNVNDLSSYSFEAVSLREIVEKSLLKYRDLIKKKNLTMQVSVFADIPMLTVDLKKISMVVDIMIENAISYSPNNGKVNIGCNRKTNKIVFFVEDSGLGLSIIDKFKLFRKFYRNSFAKKMNTDGMGLGLYLARIIVERHHGRIYGRSSGRNKGSTFYMELPLK